MSEPMNAAIPEFIVLFRACDRVASVHGDERPFGLSKLQLIKASFHSMVRAIAVCPHRIVVIGDHLSQAACDFFASYPDVELRREMLGSAQKSLAAQLELAMTQPDDAWVYLCEDDYLHQPDTFERIAHLIARRHLVFDTRPTRRNLFVLVSANPADMPLVIFPPDYPDRYQPRYRYPSYLFEDGRHHWRQVRHTTHTFMARGDTLRRFERVIRDSVIGCNDGLLYKRLYAGLFSRSRALCVSPVPALTTHLTDGVMSPVVDWETVMADTIADLRACGRW
jgi:hypothetical protein